MPRSELVRNNSDIKHLWQRHDYSGDFCFPKDGIISWQFREKDEDKKARVFTFDHKHASSARGSSTGKPERGESVRKAERLKSVRIGLAAVALSMSRRCITSLAGKMNGSGFLAEKMTTLAFSSATGLTEES